MQQLQQVDRHIRRSGDDYASSLADLLPQGPAWPRYIDSVLMRVIYGLAQYWGFVDGRAADLLERESDPRKTTELLPDWERNWGLPDPCFTTDQTIDARRRMLIWKMTLMGGQSREFFTAVSELFGITISIKEFSPFQVGVSQCGDTRGMILWNDNPGTHPEVTDYRWQLGPPEMRFYWTAHATDALLQWFRCGSGQCGVDPHLRITLPQDMDCILRRWMPAHTQLVFDFENLHNATPMTGTP